MNEANSASLTGEFRDEAGHAVINAVVTASPAQGIVASQTKPQAPKSLDQVNREFISHVLVIQVGESVIFPNNDKTQHHVYSFSPAKRFEIKLYSGVPSQPVQFDTKGVVVLGCNIHDWMVGYIYVADTPYYAKTDASGRWSIDLPAGDYNLTVWHENLDEPNASRSQIVKVAEGLNRLSDSLNLKHSRRDGKPPVTLQEQGYSSEP